MKKVLVLVAAVLLGSVAFAQKVVEIGLKGGLLLNAGTKILGGSNYSDDNYGNYDDLDDLLDGLDGLDGLDAASAFAFFEPDDKYQKLSGSGSIGFYSHFGIAEIGKGTLSLQPEMFFSFGNGVKYDMEGATLKLKYVSLDFAFLLGYDIPVGKLRITPFAGPKVGIALGKMKFKMEGDGNKVESKSEIFGSTFGVDFGVGLAVPLGNFVLGGDIRYGIDYKIKPLVEDSEAGVPIRRGALGINITAGYRF